jgi:hypothetical protein
MATKKVSPDEKALQYIALGRVRIERKDALYAKALVHSATTDGDPYFVEYHGGVWHCDCPARVNPCAHIRAVQKVIDFPAEKPTLSPVNIGTSWVDDLLDG